MAKYLRSICLLVAVVLLVAVQHVHGRTMWGARKKKAAEEKSRVVEESLQPKVFDDVEEWLGANEDISLSSQASNDIGVRKKKGPGSASFLDTEVLSTIMTTIQEYITMLEGTLDSPEFANVYDMDFVRKMLSNINMILPPEVQEMLTSEDPEAIREVAKRGLGMLRDAVNHATDAMDNPAALQTLLDTLPPELSEFVEALSSRDKKRAAKFIDKLPNVDESFKSLLLDMLLGKTDSLQNQMVSLLQDPDQIEQARLQMLENADMAKALGFSEEVLNDPEKWSALIAEGMGELQLDGTAGMSASRSDRRRHAAATRVGAA